MYMLMSTCISETYISMKMYMIYLNIIMKNSKYINFKYYLVYKSCINIITIIYNINCTDIYTLLLISILTF